MAVGDEKVTIRIDVKANTAAIDRVRAKLKQLCKEADDCADTFERLSGAMDDGGDSQRRFGKDTDDNDKKLKRFSKTAKGFAKFMSTTFKLAMIGSAIETGLLMIALSSVNGLLATGRFLVKTYHVAMSALAKAAAAAGVALATVAAAQRQYTAAMGSGRYGGSFALASRGLRTMTADSRLAALGVKSLSGAFQAASKNARVTGATTGAIAGLMDFATLSGDLEKGVASVATLVSLVQKGGPTGKGVAEAAKELGPEFEKAFKKVAKGGKATSAEVMKAFASGDLAKEAGIAGAYGNVEGSLLGQFKAFLTQMQNMFADLGQRFIEPMQRAFASIREGLVVTTTKLMPIMDQFARGKMIDAIVRGVDKLSQFLVTLMRDYVPGTQNFFKNMANFWNKLVGGFKRFSDYLNRFSAASKIMNEFFGNILGAFGSGIKENFENFAAGVLDNKDEFLKFSKSIGDLVKDILDLFKAFRNAFFDALPTIRRITDAIGGLINMVSGLINALSALPGSFGGLLGYVGPLLGLKMLTGYMGKSPAERRRSQQKRQRRMGAAKRGGKRVGQFIANNPGVLGIAGGLGLNYLTDMGPGWLESLGDVGSAAMIGGGAGHLIGKTGPAAGVGALALGGIAATHQASKFASEGLYRATGGNRAAATGGGALAGAATGAAVGAALTMFGGPTALVGALIGGLIGGIYGGIQGFLQDGKFKKKAKEAAGKFVTAYSDMVEQAFAGNNIKSVRYAYKNFERYAQEVADGQVKSGTAMTEATKLWGKEVERFEPTLKIMESRYKELTNISGMTEDQIMDLANAAEIDLGSSLINLQDVLAATGIAVRRIGEDFNEAFTDVYARGVGSIQRAADALKAPQVINEAAEALREAALEGSLTTDTLAGGLQTIMQQQLLLSGGDPLAAYQQLLMDLGAGPGGGGQFNIAGNVFNDPEGLIKQAFAEAGFEGLRQLGFGELQSGLADITAQNIISSAAGVGQTFGMSKEALTKMLTDMDPMELAGIASRFQEGFGFMSVTGKGSRGIGGMDMKDQLVGLGLDKELVELMRPRVSEEEKTRTSLNNMVTGFKGSVQEPFTAAVENFAAAVEKFAGTGGDTSSPRSNLVNTMGAHSRFDMAIAGNRRVSSGYRTWNLGSMSSDHASGRAYDLVGQNLGLYQMAVRAAGGYAEFHGGTAGRHLHVVPNVNSPIGDTATPNMGTAVVTSPSGGSTVVNMTVNAAPGMDVNALASEVMYRLERETKSKQERY